MPAPRYSIWQSIAASLSLATRAIQEVRALAREPGPPGPAGADSLIPGPPGPEPYVGEVCGLWEPERSYRKFDLVTFNGSEWRARLDDPGSLPGNGWVLAAKRGSRGEQGLRGERGLPAPVIASWEMRDYRVVPIMSDGSVGPPLDLTEVFALYYQERG